MVLDLFLQQPGYVLFFSRVVLGGIMVFYGYPKVKNLASNAKDFEGMGFKPGMFWGTIVAFLEFFGGIAILLGLLTTAISVLFGIQMIVGTIWKLAIRKKPFSDYSYDVLLLVLCLILITFGPGVHSLGRF